MTDNAMKGEAMRSYSTVIAVLCLLSVTAFAGKREREMMTQKVAPAVATAEANFKSSCGCAVKITVDETALKSIEEMRGAQHIAEDVGKSVGKYCSDAASKKAICQLKTLTLTKGPTAGFTFKDGAGVATTDGNARCGWDQIVKVLDK
jgi:hypothetical protein